MLAKDHIYLKNSLNFLHVIELKNICNKLELSEKGKKGELILRIIKFIETGEKLTIIPFPKISCARKDEKHELAENSLMLKGNYKNDLKTRLFFKKLIGEQFHFTAFGIDWLNERWMNGNPPTYKEFANMWIAETTRRKTSPAEPKSEWAYINFLQDYYSKYPESSRENATRAWEQERAEHKHYVEEILKEKYE